jgi:hypothetical protein
VIAKVTRGNGPGQAVHYLFSAGRHNEHKDPHVVAAAICCGLKAVEQFSVPWERLHVGTADAGYDPYGRMNRSVRTFLSANRVHISATDLPPVGIVFTVQSGGVVGRIVP